MLIKREYFRFFEARKSVGWNRLNLRKELKQASRILDLGLETTLLKFTQLYQRLYANIQGCPWDIFICPLCLSHPIPWDVSHGIPVGMTFPRTSLGLSMGHIYLSHSHPTASSACPIPWDVSHGIPIGMTFPCISLPI